MHPHSTLEWIVSYVKFVALVYCDVGGAMAQWLLRSLSIERSGFEPWSGHIVVLLGTRLLSYFHNASLHPGVQIGTVEGNLALD